MLHQTRHFICIEHPNFVPLIITKVQNIGVNNSCLIIEPHYISRYTEKKKRKKQNTMDIYITL